jgi:hypothetical protein
VVGERLLVSHPSSLGLILTEPYRPWFEKRAAIEAIVFLVAAVLAIITSAAYADKPLGNTEVLLLLASIVATGFIYYLRLPRAYISRKTIINDLLLIAGVSLGPTYRLNIMKPKAHHDDSQRTFGFVCHFRMKDLHRYEGLIKMSTRGTGEAFCEKRLVYLAPAQWIAGPGLGSPGS